MRTAAHRCVLALVLLLVALPAQAGAQEGGACEKKVDLPLVQATTEGCLNKTGEGQWESTDLVKINGLPVKAAPETKLVLNGPSTESPGGKIAITTEVTIGGFTLKQQAISANLPEGGNGDEKDFVTLEPGADQSVFGLKMSGKVSLRFGKTAEGTPYSNLVVVVNLPELLKRGPDDKSGGLTNTLALRVDESGLKADAVKLEVANAYLGSLEVKNLCLSYTAAGSSTSACKPPENSSAPAGCAEGNTESRWDGTAEVTIPTSSRPKLSLFAGIRGGAFSYAGAEVKDLGTSVPIATGVFLDKFGLGLCVAPPPFAVKGTTGIKFGPGGKAYLDGSIEYRNSEPWVIEAKGSLKLFDQEVASGRLKYQSSGEIDFGFQANMNFGKGLLSVEGGVEGWYQPKGEQFDVFGKAKVCAVKVVCTSGEVAVSNIGVAGCVTLISIPYPKFKWFKVKMAKAEIRAGGSYRWENGKVNVMGNSCGTGDFRVKKSIAAAQDGEGVQKLKLKETPSTVLQIKGDGAAPKVEIKGPKGDTIKADEPGELKEGKYFFAQDEETNTLNVTIAHPDAGEWTIRPLGGSKITGVSEAEVRPQADAVGQVTDVKGDKVKLEYLFDHQEDQTIEFVEWAAETHQVIGKAKGGKCDKPLDVPEDGLPGKPKLTCGEIEFEPGPGPKGERKIIGVVMNDGVTVDKIKVAEYKAPKEKKLAAPQDVKVSRAGSKASIAWMRVNEAKGYRINVELGTGESMVYIVEGGDKVSFDIPDAIAEGTEMKVQVSAIEPDGSPGKIEAEASAGKPGGDTEPEPPGVPPSEQSEE